MNRLSQINRPAGLVMLLLGVVLISGAAFIISCSHSNQDQNVVAASDGPPLAARVDQLDGTAGIASLPAGQDQNSSQAGTGWTQATVNAPVSVGSRIYARENSKLGVAFSGRNYARLNPSTSLDVLSLSQRRTQLALREGSCVFSVGALAHDELFEVGTPDGAIDFTEPGLYQVGIDDTGSTLVSCLSGTASVVGLGGTSQINKGQLLTLAAAAAADAVVSRLSPAVAGSICNDYYSYRYPSTYDGRYADYDRYLDDPYYYDPYRRSVSYQYIPDDSEVAGLDDLDGYGDWSDVSGYGHCWRPRVSDGWAPYRDGYWSDDRALGLTWVASERWGWAPYHYGRWAFANQAWYWVPAEVTTRPVYSPALVAFVPLPEPDRVGWVPLGPGDPYVPRYYDQDYRPQYIGGATVVNKYVNITNIVNYNVPGAVTVVPTTAFTSVITPAVVQTVDTSVLARTRPVMDPFAVPSVREMAPNMMAVKPRVEVPITVQQSLARPVVISQNPVVPPVVATNVQTLKAQPVAEDVKKRKLQLREAPQPVAATRPDGLPVSPVVSPPQPGQNSSQQQAQSAAATQQQAQSAAATQQRQARISKLTTDAEQGNKAARREIRQLQEEQRVQDKVDRKTARQAGLQPPAAQPAPQTQQAQETPQRKAEKQAARQQAQQAEQQRQTQAAQLAAQQKAQKQAARQQAQQQAEQAAAQQEQQRQQEKARRKAEQQQQTQQQAQQPAQQLQQRQEEKARRKAEQQQQTQQQAQQPAQQQRQEEKARRKAEQQQQTQQQAQQAAQQQQQAAEQRHARKQAQQQAAQQQAQQAEQQRQQQKAERRAQSSNAAQNPQQASPSKAERKAKNKNKNSGEQ